MKISDIANRFHEGIAVAANRGAGIVKACEGIGKALREMFQNISSSAFKSLQKNDFTEVKTKLASAKRQLDSIENGNLKVLNHLELSEGKHFQEDLTHRAALMEQVEDLTLLVGGLLNSNPKDKELKTQLRNFISQCQGTQRTLIDGFNRDLKKLEELSKSGETLPEAPRSSGRGRSASVATPAPSSTGRTRRQSIAEERPKIQHDAKKQEQIRAKAEEAKSAERQKETVQQKQAGAKEGPPVPTIGETRLRSHSVGGPLEFEEEAARRQVREKESPEAAEKTKARNLMRQAKRGELAEAHALADAGRQTVEQPSQASSEVEKKRGMKVTKGTAQTVTPHMVSEFPERYRLEGVNTIINHHDLLTKQASGFTASGKSVLADLFQRAADEWKSEVLPKAKTISGEGLTDFMDSVAIERNIAKQINKRIQEGNPLDAAKDVRKLAKSALLSAFNSLFSEREHMDLPKDEMAALADARKIIQKPGAPSQKALNDLAEAANNLRDALSEENRDSDEYRNANTYHHLALFFSE